MKKGIIAGNWKMNLSIEEGVDLIKNILSKTPNVEKNGKVIIIPSYIHLSSANELLKNREGFLLGAQGCNPSTVGDLTGGVSGKMLESVGARYVLVGHSEQRTFFLESEDLLREKMQGILTFTNITPIFCCGESLESRSQGTYLGAISDQISEVLSWLQIEELARVIIAYEPRWAIGTGVVPSPFEIEEMLSHIKNCLAAKYPEGVVSQVPILYGGSCNSQNAASIYSCHGVDGLLVGRASLSASDFCEIIRTTIL